MTCPRIGSSSEELDPLVHAVHRRTPGDATPGVLVIPKLERNGNMENGNSPKCDTIGCPNRAVATLRWRDRESDTEYTDMVCRSCGDGYVARPALRATLEPIEISGEA